MGTRKTPIGCQRDAKLAVKAYLGGLPYRDPRITHVGGGVNREVYVDEQRAVVYKVGSSEANEDEHVVASDLRDEGFRWAPPTYIHYVNGHAIMAMPYYAVDGEGELDDGDLDPIAERVLTEVREAGVHDVHQDNWRRTRSGHVRVIDYVGWGYAQDEWVTPA